MFFCVLKTDLILNFSENMSTGEVMEVAANPIKADLAVSGEDAKDTKVEDKKLESLTG